MCLEHAASHSKVTMAISFVCCCCHAAAVTNLSVRSFNGSSATTRCVTALLSSRENLHCLCFSVRRAQRSTHLQAPPLGTSDKALAAQKPVCILVFTDSTHLPPAALRRLSTLPLSLYLKPVRLTTTPSAQAVPTIVTNCGLMCVHLLQSCCKRLSPRPRRLATSELVRTLVPLALAVGRCRSCPGLQAIFETVVAIQAAVPAEQLRYLLWPEARRWRDAACSCSG